MKQLDWKLNLTRPINSDVIPIAISVKEHAEGLYQFILTYANADDAQRAQDETGIIATDDHKLAFISAVVVSGEITAAVKQAFNCINVTNLDTESSEIE